MIQPLAPEDTAVGAGLLWNPGAISYLSLLLLALMLSAYLGKRAYTERRQGRDFVPTLLFCLTIGFLVPGLLTALYHAMAGGGWLAYAMPWLSPSSFALQASPWISFMGGSAAAAFIQFAYRFPRRLPGTERESMVIGALMGVALIAEAAVAVRTDIGLIAGDPWMRPDWAANWLNASTLWLGLLFVRQFLHAQSALLPQPPSGLVGNLKALWQMVASPPANREAKAARGFVVFALLPIVHTTGLVLQNEGLLGPYSTDILICWSVLAQLTGFTLVYLGYLPERSSFLFKLTTISVVLLLATVNGASWIVGPGYFSQFRAPGMVVAGQEVRFSPMADGTYAVGEVPLAPEPVAGRIIDRNGAEVPLPFDFSFFGRTHRKIHVAGDGTIGFEHPPRPTDLVFRYGAQPAIYPLLVAIPESGTTVQVRVHPRRVVVTRRDHCAPLQDRCYGFQAVLHANGRVDFAYLTMPAQPRFMPFEPLAAPWLMGISPGYGTSLGTAPSAPIIRDYYHDFLTHLDRLYRPIVPFLIGAVLLAMVGMPMLYRGFLVRPLDRLLRGIRRFRDGELGTQVRVSFNDEIGYLTESFNAMARSQHDMVNGLEAMVAERVEEVTDIAARNAQLEERARLSADLHDSVSQTLFSAALLADTVPEQWRRDPEQGAQAVARLAQLNRNALAEMRELLAELRSGSVEQQLPPGERIEALAREFAVAHGIAMHVEVNGGGALPPEVSTTFHRVAQEGLNNIARHSGAQEVRVTFECLPGQALLVIGDDGCGFDPDGVVGDHLGLKIMRERAERIEASLEVDSAPGRGTTVTLVWMEHNDG
ncbi:histidine kinase [Erythrobacter sp. SG61-1L]|uniref:HAMP domain-containing sensor histidine kinase n=1 Tax=Erythrobacter sp. SG61-1L TaxID=1603897 RepID=UPI000B17D091|nr:histidine kinase [Erythrobacter sp. SG61-1L]